VAIRSAQVCWVMFLVVGVSACSGGAVPVAATVTVTQPPVTVTSTVTTTVTVTATATQTVRVTVTAPPRTVVAQPVGPIDVSAQYLGWHRVHPEPSADDQAQYQAVRQVTLNAGQLDVITVYAPPGWGWHCGTEPATLAGQKLWQIRVLNNDGSVFILCPAG
jgi:hypothetical protein